MSVELENAPTDLISCLRFNPVGDRERLLVSSWDAGLRLYDMQDGSLENHIMTRAPILDVCWEKLSGVHCFSGGMERRAYKVDLETGQKDIIGEDHEGGVSSIVHDTNTRSVITGSWDKSLQQLDPRGQGTSRFTTLPGKVFCMDSIENLLVVGMSDRQFHIYDVRNLQEPLQRRESSLKYPTRTLRCSPDGQGYATTSIEGRVAVEFFDPNPDTQSQKYAFKCHRIVDKVNGIDTVTPVNALAFHAKYGTFFSGGSDAVVCLWDQKAKKRLKQYHKQEHAVVSLDVNPTGSLLAIGVSDDSYKENPVERGPTPSQSKVIVRQLAPDEGKGKFNK